MIDYTTLIIIAGGFVSGLITGAMGFGTGLVALPIWLQAVSPLVAAPLVAACTIVVQLQTLPRIWHASKFADISPVVFGGLIGVPFGTMLLPHVPAPLFRIVAGIVLIIVCVSLLAMRMRPLFIKHPWRLANTAVGIVGGVLGGFSGLSGPPLAIWSTLLGTAKNEKRALFQWFNLFVLAFSLASHGMSGLFNEALIPLLLQAIPATVIGAALGYKLYSVLNVTHFNDLVLIILVVAGGGLVVTGFVNVP